MNADPDDLGKKYMMAGAEYSNTKYVREDNTPENAEYLGYINGNELYPDFKFVKFTDFIDDLIAGKGKRPYPNLQL